MQQRFRIGEIANTHGIQGEVKVYPTTDDAERFRTLKECILDTGTQEMLVHITSCRFFKQFVILKFREFGNINEVERYKRCGLYVTRENAVPLQKDEYYIADLIGITVYDEEETLLGHVRDVLQTGANDVYVVAPAQADSGKELLIPALRQCILQMDVEQGRMQVRLLPGLTDL